MNHLREVAERLRIRGDYDNRGSDVADATACTEAADELERLTAVALAARALVRDVPLGRARLCPCGGFSVAGPDVEVVAEPALTALESALAEAGYDLTDEELAQSEEQRGG